MTTASYLDHPYESIQVSSENQIVHVNLNRPEKYNALSMDMLGELKSVLAGLEEDDNSRVLILSGSGKSFCAGLDLSGPLAEGGNLSNSDQIRIQRQLSQTLVSMHRIRQPIIAVAQGAACGIGLGLLCAADIRYGSPSLKANAAFLKIGFTGCDMGVSYFLPKIIGLTAANEMMLTGRFYKADKLLARGFLADIVHETELLETALGTAKEMLKATPFGLRMTKEGIRHNLNANSLEAAIALEDRQQILSGYSADQERAIMAFLSKSEADFQDN